MNLKIYRLRPTIIAAYFVILILCVGVLTRLSQNVISVSGIKKTPIYSVDIDEKKISLGINCAWDNADITELISILKHYNIKATFFVVGSWCNKYPESVKEIFNAGHEIGSHSNTHTDMTTLSSEQILKQIRSSGDKIEKLTGKRPLLIRTPSGAYNSKVISLIEGEGMFAIQWNIDSIDYNNPTPQQMRDKIIKKLRPGSITLFHSGAKNTPDALPLIIEAVQSAGYEFVLISDIIYIDKYWVDYEGRQHKSIS